MRGNGIESKQEQRVPHAGKAALRAASFGIQTCGDGEREGTLLENLRGAGVFGLFSLTPTLSRWERGHIRPCP